MAADLKKNRGGQGPNLTGGETAGPLAAIDERAASVSAGNPAGGMAAAGSAQPPMAANARQVIVSKPVSVSPLSALLPQLGDGRETKNLEAVLDLLTERLEDLRQERPSDSEEQIRARMLEEEMLTRVVDWARGENSSKRAKGG